MNLFIRDAKTDPFVPYHGKVLPTDKAPLRVVVPDPNVNYEGHTLPADKVTYTRPAKDLTNNPSRTLIGGYQLPLDCAIYLTGEKVIAQTNILDGVAVFERILRKPYYLEFEMTIRTLNAKGDGYVFPQEELLSLWTKVWLPDTVQTVENTLLNKLGIQEMVVERVYPTTVRGSKNLPLRITGFENIPGDSLIIA